MFPNFNGEDNNNNNNNDKMTHRPYGYAKGKKQIEKRRSL